MKKIPIILLLISFISLIFIVLATGGGKTVENRLLDLERKIEQLENLGGKHIKPSKISTSEIVLREGDKVIFSDNDASLINNARTWMGQVSEDNLQIYVGNNQVMIMTDGLVQFSKVVKPNGTALDLGTAAEWWDNIHYKTLVAHSLKNKKEVCAVNAIKKINIVDKSSYPEDVFIPSEMVDGEMGAEGTNINQLIVYLIDAIKELNARVEAIEK